MTSVQSFLQYIYILNSVKICAESMCEMTSHAPQLLFHNVSPINPRVVILEYAHSIREKEIHWWNNLVNRMFR